MRERLVREGKRERGGRRGRESEGGKGRKIGRGTVEERERSGGSKAERYPKLTRERQMDR